MPVQAVEFAEYGRDGLSPLFGIAAGDQHFDPGAKDEGLLLLQRRAAASAEEQGAEQRRQRQESPHACSMAVMVAPAASHAFCAPR